MVNLQRRGLFSSQQQPDRLRPPWAVDEALFQDACTRCGDCLDACPERILIREGVNGYPIVNFQLGECTFCQKCVTVCATGALDAGRAAWPSAKAVVHEACLAQQGVICTTCAEQCEVQAITFPLIAGAVSQPHINQQACTGCGACVAPCPTQAVSVLHVDMGEQGV